MFPFLLRLLILIVISLGPNHKLKNVAIPQRMKEFSESIFPVMKERGFSQTHVTVCATISFKSLRACVCVFKFFSQDQISLSTIFAFPAKSLMPWDIYVPLFLYCQLSVLCGTFLDCQ